MAVFLQNSHFNFLSASRCQTHIVNTKIINKHTGNFNSNVTLVKLQKFLTLFAFSNFSGPFTRYAYTSRIFSVSVTSVTIYSHSVSMVDTADIAY